jgi:WD40 repeat protein
LRHNDLVFAAAFAPDGSVVATGATAGDEGDVTLWNPVTGKELRDLTATGTVRKLSFSPDGSLLVASGESDTVDVWNATTGAGVLELKVHTDYVRDAEFSPDGALLVTVGDDRLAHIWDVRSGNEVAVLRGHTAAVNTAAFSPDGALVVTASDDHTARLWDARTGRELAILRPHAAEVLSAMFSPRGDRIVTASADHTASLYACSICGSIGQLTALGRHRAVRALSVAERATYLHERRSS